MDTYNVPRFAASHIKTKRLEGTGGKMYPDNYYKAAAEYENQRAIDCEGHYGDSPIICDRCGKEVDAAEESTDGKWFCFDCIDDIADQWIEEE